MFRLNVETEYAYLALLSLSKNHEKSGVTKLSDIIGDRDLSEKFMVQALSDLRRAGLVESRRGKNGGYLLARAPEEITLTDLLLATAGKNAQVKEGFDTSGKGRFLAKWWGAVLAEIQKHGRQISLAEAVEAESGEVPMYHI